MAFFNDHLYVGGVCNDSGREKCRLFEYSLSANTWDMFDTHIADFALASYKSTLMLIGGLEYRFCRFHSSEKSPMKLESLFLK